MAALLLNKGEEVLCNWLRATMNGAGLDKDVFVRLFKNNITPVATNVVGDFTEADFKGYVAGGIQADTWAAAVVAGSGYMIAGNTTEHVYDSGAGGSASNDVYGAYVVDEDNNCLAAERFPGAPIVMAADGNEIHYTPQIKLTEETEACA